MSSNTDPNKPEIITRAPFGGKSTVSLGGNRYSIKSETLFRAANAIAIPSRGMAVDAALWVSGYGFLFRVPFSLLQRQFIPLYLGLGLFALIFIPSLGWLLTVGRSLPDHRPDCLARFCMILGGLLVATNGFWIRGWLNG